MLRRILSLLWTLVLRLRAYLYSRDILKSHKSAIKIISIGNISLGGAGKTPFAIWLSKRLIEKGLKVAVLERGYKSGLPKKESRLLQKDEINMTKNQANTLSLSLIGDEARMVWDVLPSGARLCVCSDKTKGAIEIEKKWPDTDLIVLDDGFQHLRLKRDINIVLMDASEAFSDRIFPMGRLRESYTSLKRADILIFTKSDALKMEDTSESKKERQVLAEKAKAFNPNIKIFFATGVFKTNLDLKGKRVFPVSSIYDPKYFHFKLKETGAVFERYMAFRDHYAYDKKTVKMILNSAKSFGAEYLAVTSKDWVKIKPIIENMLEQNKNNIKDQFVECSYDHNIEDEKEFLSCCI
jgi:tetraacyldisaccharide 4'-kinase